MTYISGRADVGNIEHYKSQFERAREYMNKTVFMYDKAGESVYTLLDLYEGVKVLKDLSDYMQYEELEDRMKIVKKCDRLYLLKGWENDDMCRFEHIVAKAYGKPITYSKKF